MKSTIEEIISRRSIRKYTDEPVNEDDLNRIIESGLYAASGSGKQQAIMLVVQDQAMLEKLERMNAEVVGRDPEKVHNFYGAKTVIVVLAPRNNNNSVADGSLVMGNMMLAAHALGLGSCWINRARETFDTEEGKKILQDLEIEGDYIGIGNLIVGHIAGEYPQPAPRKENRVYRV